MPDNASVEHLGKIESIDGHQVRVGFISHSACSGCHARGACSLSEVDNKYVDIIDDSEHYKVGESVKILLHRNEGFKALFYGYLLPFIVLLSALLITHVSTGREGLSGLVGVGSLIPYYAILYWQREKLKQKFHFIIKKID